MTQPPPPPRWFGPRASTDDPAVAALIDRLAVEAEWADIGGGFNLNVRIDTVPPTVLRVHRPWPTRRRVAGLRRLRERLVGAGVHVARPIAMLGHDVVRVGDRWAELEDFVPHMQPAASQESYVRLFEELGRLHAGLRAVWEPGPPEPLDDHRTVRQLRYWLGFTRRRLGTAAAAVVTRAGHLLDQLAAARKGVELPRAPIHGDYKLGNAVALENGSWANLDLDFVRVRERIYDVAGSLYWAVESGAELDRPLLLEAYDRTAPEPLTADETRLLPTALTWIPLHWVATAGFIGGVPEAERALAAAEAWWSRREDLSWYPERPSQVTG